MKHTAIRTVCKSILHASVGVLTLTLHAVELRCAIEVNGEVHQLIINPTQNPYAVQGTDIGERFRFKAVVVGTQDEIAIVNIYVYYQTKRQPMVMHHAKHLNPAPQFNPKPDALTGRVALYSPVLGKELAYQCALHKISP